MYLRDLNVDGISVQDGRRIEVAVNGLPVYHGKQVIIDSTLVSPLRADGRPRPRADVQPGIALKDAKRNKLRTYPEIVASGRCHLLVASTETGGRWDDEAYKFLVCLAKAKARTSPATLRSALTNAWLRRWTGMIAFANQNAFASSLVEDTPGATLSTDGVAPDWGVLLDGAD